MPCMAYENEELRKHSLDVANCVGEDRRLAVIVRRLLVLVNKEGLFGDVMGVLRLSASIHDVGKAIRHYQAGDLVSFRYHDMVGGVLLYRAITKSEGLAKAYIDAREVLRSPQPLERLRAMDDTDFLRVIFVISAFTSILFHLYAYRSELTESSRLVWDSIEKYDLTVGNECLETLRHVIIETAMQENTKSIAGELTRALESVTVGGAITCGERQEVSSTYKVMNETDGELAWFLEGLMAAVNKCDSDTARRNREPRNKTKG